MKFRWSKSLSPVEAVAWEEILQSSGDPNCVLLAQPGNRAEIQIYVESKTEADALKKEHGGKVVKFKEENWVAMGMEQSVKRTILVRDQMVITLDTSPEFVEALHQKYPKRTLLLFPPDMAFGTGDHATTASCLRILVDLAPELRNQKWSLLDLGTGTGILAIAGRKLGASSVFACDHDPKSIRVSKESFARNEVKGIKLKQVDLLQPKAIEAFPGIPYTIVTANLFSTVLIKVMPLIRKTVDNSGWAILSGILAKQSAEVEASAQGEGFQIVRKVRLGRWVSLLLRP